jgi:hypothetical protein
MNAPVPQVFKVFSLHRYFTWCAEMREHYQQVGMQVSPTPSFFEKENAGRAFMYLSYWQAGLFVVSEGWKDLKLSDTEVDALLKSPHLEKLKRFRHGVYHYQPGYFDQRFMGAFVAGEDFAEWAESLMLAFARYFDAWIENQIAAFPAVEPAAYGLEEVPPMAGS